MAKCIFIIIVWSMNYQIVNDNLIWIIAHRMSEYQMIMWILICHGMNSINPFISDLFTFSRGWLPLVDFIVNVYSILLMPCRECVCVCIRVFHWYCQCVRDCLWVSASMYNSTVQITDGKWRFEMAINYYCLNSDWNTSFMARTTVIYIFRIEEQPLFIL